MISTLEFILLVVALVFALIEEFRAAGHSLGWWAVVIIALVLLVPHVA